MKTLNDINTEKINGMHYGGRILLPFRINIFHAILVKKSLMSDGKDLEYSANFDYRINDDFTEICFPSYEDLSEHFSEDDIIKLYVTEKGNDIFDENNRVWINLHLLDNNKVRISI